MENLNFEIEESQSGGIYYVGAWIDSKYYCKVLIDMLYRPLSLDEAINKAKDEILEEASLKSDKAMIFKINSRIEKSIAAADSRLNERLDAFKWGVFSGYVRMNSELQLKSK